MITFRKKFWIKLDYAKKYGVPLPPDESATPSVAPTPVAPAPVAPVVPTANIQSPTVEDTPNHKPWLLKTGAF